jgi:hypothetical protein
MARSLLAVVLVLAGIPVAGCEPGCDHWHGIYDFSLPDMRVYNQFAQAGQLNADGDAKRAETARELEDVIDNHRDCLSQGEVDYGIALLNGATQ